MDKKDFEKAADIRNRIKHLTELLDMLSRREYSLDQPSLPSVFTIYSPMGPHIDLNAGEVVYIRQALQSAIERLEQEFQAL